MYSFKSIMDADEFFDKAIGSGFVLFAFNSGEVCTFVHQEL